MQEPGLLDFRWGIADDGAVVEVALSKASQLRHLLEVWPPTGLMFATEHPQRRADRRLAILETDEVLIDGAASPGQWFRVESDLALFAVERLHRLVAVHAGLFAWDDRGILVPGRSGAGKSTLCVAAAEAGAVVLTDEFVLVDPRDGVAVGWPRPVRVRGSDGTMRRSAVPLHHGSVHISLVALLEYGPGKAVGWSAVDGSDGLLGILANTVCARSRPDEALDAAIALIRGARCVAGRRGDALAAAQALREIVKQPRQD